MWEHLHTLPKPIASKASIPYISVADSAFHILWRWLQGTLIYKWVANNVLPDIVSGHPRFPNVFSHIFYLSSVETVQHDEYFWARVETDDKDRAENHYPDERDGLQDSKVTTADTESSCRHPVDFHGFATGWDDPQLLDMIRKLDA